MLTWCSEDNILENIILNGSINHWLLYLMQLIDILVFKVSDHIILSIKLQMPQEMASELTVQMEYRRTRHHKQETFMMMKKLYFNMDMMNLRIVIF